MGLTVRKIRKIRSMVKRYDVYIDPTHKFDFMTLKPTRHVFAQSTDDACLKLQRRNARNITTWKQERVWYYSVNTRREANFAIVPYDIKRRSEIAYYAIGLTD